MKCQEVLFIAKFSKLVKKLFRLKAYFYLYIDFRKDKTNDI